MKKLITLTFTIMAFLLSSVAIQAQHYKKHKKHNNTYGRYQHTNYYKTGYRNGQYNRRGVYVFYKTKYNWRYGQKYKKTYKITIYPNGSRKVKLVNVQRVNKHFYNTGYNNGYGYGYGYGYGVKTYYKSHIVYSGWKRYKVTYKIKHYQNGRIKRKLISKKRLYYW